MLEREHSRINLMRSCIQMHIYEGDEAFWGPDTADATLKVKYSIHITVAVAGALPIMTRKASKQNVSPVILFPRIWSHSTLVKKQNAIVSHDWLEVNLIPMN